LNSQSQSIFENSVRWQIVDIKEREILFNDYTSAFVEKFYGQLALINGSSKQNCKKFYWRVQFLRNNIAKRRILYIKNKK